LRSPLRLQDGGLAQAFGAVSLRAETGGYKVFEARK
jgi:16S rRNA G1207 methylase RsmC